jgi:hypothetical protein
LNNNNTVRVAPGTLNGIWYKSGARVLRERYRRTVQVNRERAAALVADKTANFPVIYTLSPILEKEGLAKHLPPHAKHAMRIVGMKSGDGKRAERYGSLLCDDNLSPEPDGESLKWIITTGSEWDGPSGGHDEYDAAIDAAVALFCDGYDDHDVMKTTADLIYRRNRKGQNIHDIVWGFYKTANPNTLSYLANHLTSENELDAQLTVKLMSFDDPGTKQGRQKLKTEYLQWLSENRPYLYATGEHFNATSVPYSVRHDREAKLLKHEIEPRFRSPKKPLDENEYQTLLKHRAEGKANDND